MPLDELKLRKPGFTEGVTATLGDGQEWTFPEFWYRFTPQIDDDGRIVTSGRATYGPEHERDVDILFGSLDVDPLDRLDAMMRVAAGLLLSNYDLDNAALAVLLPNDSRDERLREMWGDVLRAIRGLDSPKRSPVGSAPSSGPTG